MHKLPEALNRTASVAGGVSPFDVGSNFSDHFCHLYDDGVCFEICQLCEKFVCRLETSARLPTHFQLFIHNITQISYNFCLCKSEISF